METDLVVVAQAGRTRLWAGQYQWAVKRGWEGIGEPMLTTWDELATRLQLPVAFAGEIDAAAAKLLRRSNRSAIIAPPAESVRRAATLAEIGWQRWKRKQTDDANTLAPLYPVSYTHLDVYKRQLLRIWQARPVTVLMVTHSISEAVLLADEVLVMNGRPAAITDRFAIDLPRPRSPESAATVAFQQYVAAIRGAIQST